MQRIFSLTFVFIVATTFLSLPAQGAIQPSAPNLYLSVDAGWASVDYPLNQFNPSVKLKNKGAIVWGGNIGALFTPNFGVEVGYLNLGPLSLKNFPLQDDNTAFTNNANLYIAAIKGILYGQEEDTGFSLFGKIGAARADFTYKAIANYIQASSVKQYTPYFAVGIAQNVNRQVAVSLIAHATVEAGKMATASTDSTYVPALYMATLEVSYHLF